MVIRGNQGLADSGVFKLLFCSGRNPCSGPRGCILAFLRTHAEEGSFLSESRREQPPPAVLGWAVALGYRNLRIQTFAVGQRPQAFGRRKASLC